MSSHPSPGPSTQPLSSRHKQKPHTVGIAAGAEDAKYQAKYKDLKRKVKEIETDNDKLHFKVLQAKRSIQRMKLERAILYERLSGTPPQPGVLDRHVAPPIQPGPSVQALQPSSRSLSGSHQHQGIGDHHPSADSERSLAEYIQSHDRPRVVIGPDGRPVPVLAPMGPGVAPPSHISGAHSPPRRSVSGTGHDSLRHLQHLPHLPPVQHMEAPRSHGHSRSHVSPTLHHAHSGSSHERHRSHSSSRSRTRHATQPYPPGHTHPQAYPDSLPPVQHVMHSPPVPERERSRRHELHELTHSDPHGNGRHSSFGAHHSPPLHPSEVRASTRVHSHQRMGPASYINRDDHYDRQRDVDREREWEREREHRDRERERERERSRDLGRSRDLSGSHILSPPSMHRTRQAMDRSDYPEHHVSSRIREDPVYYRDPPSAPGGYAVHSRSGSPVSGSGSGSAIGAGEVPSRPDSRAHYYEHDRPRSFRLRPVNPPNEDLDFVHEDGRSMSSRDRGHGGGGTFPPPEQSRSSVESRKRGRNDMDADSDDAGDGPVYTGGGRIAEDRGSKRYHREHRRSVDNQEDGRMGPP